MSIITNKFKIEGMHCSSCAMNIDFDLEDLSGVKEAKTSFARQETVVTFDSQTVAVPQLIDQIVKTGYKASLKEE